MNFLEYLPGKTLNTPLDTDLDLLLPFKQNWIKLALG